MGDSYHSGEGAPPFDPATDIEKGNLCHRSFNAAAVSLAKSPGPGVGPLNLKHVACSGATIGQLKTGRYGEPSQYDALGDDVALVTISIGGNDVGFGPVVDRCVKWTCRAVDRKDIDRKLAALPGDLNAALATIRVRAPNAKIAVVGYPYLVNEGFNCRSTIFWQPDRTWLNDIVDRGNRSIAAAVNKLNEGKPGGAVYVDLVKKFRGHGVCSRDAWINDVVGGVRATRSERNRSFHPNNKGQRAIADAMREALVLRP